jgi:hypothetical protein
MDGVIRRVEKIIGSSLSDFIEESPGFDVKFSGEFFDSVHGRRIRRALEKSDIIAIESGTMGQFLLRKPTGVSQSP